MSYGKTYYERNKAKILLKHKDYYQKNREKIIERTKNYGIKHNSRYRKYYRQHNKKLKLEVLSHYSNGFPKCNCCGENDIRFLSIDHINNDGAEQRRKTKAMKTLYFWLKKNNYPDGYQVLCFNCNWAKSHGGCSHDKIKININYLEKMIELQRNFQIRWKMYPSLDKIAAAMGAESIGELWKVSGGKWWSKKVYTHEDRLGELIDVLHFFLNYMVAEKISAEELYDAYCKKLKVNYDRQESGY